MAFDPREVGNKLIIVGENQIKTGNRLKQSGTELHTAANSLKDNERIENALGSIEAGTRSTRNLLTPVAAALHSISDAFDGITVPGIDFDRRELDLGPVGKIRVVTGISISSSRPFRAIAASVESVADDIDNIRAGLSEIATATRNVQDELPRVATRMINCADLLEKAGADLLLAGNATKDAGTLLAS